MAFKDHGHAYIDRLEPKKLPYEGTWYRFPASISAATGMLLHRMQTKAEGAVAQIEEAKAAAAAAIDGERADTTAPDLELDLDEDLIDGIPEDKLQDIRAEILGDAWAKLAEDDVPEAMVDHMFETLMIWHMFGDQDVAEAYWNDVTGPKAPTDHQAKRKSSGSTRNRTSRSGKQTRSQASIAATNH